MGLQIPSLGGILESIDDLRGYCRVDDSLIELRAQIDSHFLV